MELFSTKGERTAWAFFILFLSVIKNVSSSQLDDELMREKRSVFQFGDMISFTTKKDPLIFNHYGNHCGWISGNRPIMDEIDGCCYHHDRCYQKARNGVCAHLRVYSSMIHYDWNVIKNTIACEDRGRICQRTVCECDKMTAYCFSRSPYNRALKRRHFADIFIRRGRSRGRGIRG